MFILSTYIDSERWASAFEPLLYPSGLSFYRPFSYRAEYFHPAGTATELANPASCEKLLADDDWNCGWFGIRFGKQSTPEYQKIFVPLRKVTLVAAERLDEINLNFKLGPYVIPSGEGPDFPTLELTGILDDLSATKLFIKLDERIALIASKWSTSDTFPFAFWRAVERQFSPVVAEKLHNALVLRLSNVRQRGDANPLETKSLDTRGSTWGYELRQGAAYDVVLTHYRLKRKGGPVATVEHQFRLINPPEEMAASRRYIGLLGNYRADALWISPLISGPGPIEVAIEPRRLNAPDEIVDPTTDKAIGLRIPILVKPKRWNNKRYLNLGTSVIGGLLGLFFFRLYVNSATTDDSRKLLLAVIAIVVSLSLNALKDLLVPDK